MHPLETRKSVCLARCYTQYVCWLCACASIYIWVCVCNCLFIRRSHVAYVFDGPTRSSPRLLVGLACSLCVRKIIFDALKRKTIIIIIMKITIKENSARKIIRIGRRKSISFSIAFTMIFVEIFVVEHKHNAQTHTK